MKYDITAITKLGSSYTFYKHDLENFKNVFNIHSFVETGTAGLAATARLAATIFNDVNTIEIAPHYFEEASAFLNPLKNVKFYLGDTCEMFDLLIKNSSPRRLYWLDAHCSGGGTGGVPGFSPIQTEVEFIKKYGSIEDVFLIDDIRGDYSDKNGFLDLFNNKAAILAINPNYEFYNIGDIALAFNREVHKNVTISPLVTAMTVSRLFNPKTESIDSVTELIQEEKNMVNNSVDSRETQAILELAEEVTNANDCGGKVIYFLWKALIEYGRGQYLEAANKFEKLSTSPFSHWRFRAYQYKALMNSGQLNAAKHIFETYLKNEDSFKVFQLYW